MTMTTIFFAGKNKWHMVLVACLAASMLVSSVSSLEAAAVKRVNPHYTFSEKEENVLGEQMREWIPGEKVWNEDVKAIFAEIVKANPKDLNFDDGEHKMYLNDPKVLNDSSMVNAMTVPGGNVLISKGLLNIVNMKENIFDESKVKETGNYRRSNKADQIFNNSSVGFYLAHEMSHWYNRDWVYMSGVGQNQENIAVIKRVLFKGNPGRITDQQLQSLVAQVGTNNNMLSDTNMEVERLADLNGEYFISRTTNMSVGSAIHGFWKARKNLGFTDIDEEESWKPGSTGKHPGTLGREKTLYNKFIKGPLGALVDFDFTTRAFTVGGKAWFGNGHGLGTKEVTAEERTIFFIGQMASLRAERDSHENDIQSNDIEIRPITYLNPNVKADQTLVYAKLTFKDGHTYSKLLDKFNIAYDRVNVLVGFKTVPAVREEEYLLYELSECKRLLLS